MKKSSLILVLFIQLLFSSCGKSQTDFTFVNTSHLDALYEEIDFQGQEAAIIHIYSNYPSYEWIGDDDEGIACIDDVARAAVFYLQDFRTTNNIDNLIKAGKLTEFILLMQAENGYYYNFIFEDYSINTSHKNSLPEPNWWSWRAMWALSEAYEIYIDIDTDFAGRISGSLDKAVDAIKKNLPVEEKTFLLDGFHIPLWLPNGTAADQAGVLLLSLVPYYNIKKDDLILEFIHALQKGIALLQVDDENSFASGAFLSWRTLWHAYGNIQTYSIIKFSYLSKNEDLLKLGLKEINYFYKSLMEKGYLANFSLLKTKDGIVVKDLNKFSQIAYNIRPMVYACLAAYEATKETGYLEQAAEIAGWFFGKNPAGSQMYFPETGIGFDGINSENEINMNSGAESTIEALLTLQAIENYPIAKEILTDIYKHAQR